MLCHYFSVSYSQRMCCVMHSLSYIRIKHILHHRNESNDDSLLALAKTAELLSQLCLRLLYDQNEQFLSLTRFEPPTIFAIFSPPAHIYTLTTAWFAGGKNGLLLSAKPKREWDVAYAVDGRSMQCMAWWGGKGSLTADDDEDRRRKKVSRILT